MISFFKFFIFCAICFLMCLVVYAFEKLIIDLNNKECGSKWLSFLLLFLSFCFCLLLLPLFVYFFCIL